METKKQYIAPSLKCVEFKAEHGFAGSTLSQGFNNWNTNWYDKPDKLTYDNFNTFNDGNPFKTGGRNGGYFTGNNEDWD